MEFLLTILKWVGIFFVGGLFLLVALGFVNDTLGSIAARRHFRAHGNREEWKRVKAGLGLGVDELARRLGWPANKLLAFTPGYTRASIPKRSGEGMRELWIPNRSTKALQRTLLRRVLAKLRAHEAACAFERNKSIVDNARPHVGRAVVVRMDVVDFFPSTKAKRLDHYFRFVGWDAEAAALLVKLTTRKDGLPQGAPTSPRLSNLVNYYLDVQLTNLAEKRRGAYTRYADDITFSFPKDYPRKVRGIIWLTKMMLKSKGYRMHKRKKLSIRRRHQRQVVTGLVVNDAVNIPRHTRRWLRAVRHRAARGGRATLTEHQLQGWAAFEQMVERR